MRAGFNGLIAYLANAGCLPGDSDEDRLRKAVLAFLAAIGAAAGFIWGCMYLAFGLPFSALMPLACSVFASAGLVIFIRTHRYVPEKIRTVGDNYFAVAGAPIARADHAEAAAEFALAMLQVLQSQPDDPMRKEIGTIYSRPWTRVRL